MSGQTEVGLTDQDGKKIEKEFEGKLKSFESLNAKIVIKNEEQFQAVDYQVKLSKRLQADAEETFKPTIAKYYDPYKFWLGIKNGIVERLKGFEKIGKQAQIAYLDECERIRKEKEKKAQDEADEKTRKKQEALNNQAEQAAASGNTEKAEKLREKAETTIVASKPVIDNTPKTAGTSLRDNWVGEVVDLKALIKAVAEGRAPGNLIMANESAINKQAKATKDTFPIDGIKFKNEKTLASSTKGI